MNEYNRFSLEFAASLTASGWQHLPRSFLAVGVLWPSMLSEDDPSPADQAAIAAATKTESWRPVKVTPETPAPDLSADRLVLADLTAVHETKVILDEDDSDVGGCHSDIFRPETYDLIASFLFGPRSSGRRSR